MKAGILLDNDLRDRIDVHIVPPYTAGLIIQSVASIRIIIDGYDFLVVSHLHRYPVILSAISIVFSDIHIIHTVTVKVERSIQGRYVDAIPEGILPQMTAGPTLQVPCGSQV